MEVVPLLSLAGVYEHESLSRRREGFAILFKQLESCTSSTGR
jgi:hypothetical protein